MRKYISYGGGVNSTAMIIHMLNTNQQFDEIIFADTGCECPETYEYMDYFESGRRSPVGLQHRDGYLKPRGMTITRISAKEMGLENCNLLEFFQQYSMIPSRMMRACTSRFKVLPIFKYYDEPCIQYLGIDAGEAHRAKPSRNNDIESAFPLVEAGITRSMCVDIIKAEGLCVPRKSGCYLCAFARIAHFKQLYKNHPKLFSVCLELEKAHYEKHNLGKEGHIFIKDKPMRELAERFKTELDAEDKQGLLWDDPQDAMSCLCRYG